MAAGALFVKDIVTPLYSLPTTMTTIFGYSFGAGGEHVVCLYSKKV